MSRSFSQRTLAANPRGQRAGRRSFLWAAHYCRALATYPEVTTHRAGTCAHQSRHSSPIWSCSVWGFPCHRHHWRRGALLPHLFTLTPPIILTGRTEPVKMMGGAVCFLWHSPSAPLERRRPDVIRHTALWSSDFPLPVLPPVRPPKRRIRWTDPAATVRPSS